MVTCQERGKKSHLFPSSSSRISFAVEEWLVAHVLTVQMPVSVSKDIHQSKDSSKKQIARPSYGPVMACPTTVADALCRTPGAR